MCNSSFDLAFVNDCNTLCAQYSPFLSLCLSLSLCLALARSLLLSLSLSLSLSISLSLFLSVSLFLSLSGPHELDSFSLCVVAHSSSSTPSFPIESAPRCLFIRVHLLSYRHLHIYYTVHIYIYIYICICSTNKKTKQKSKY